MLFSDWLFRCWRDDDDDDDDDDDAFKPAKYLIPDLYSRSKEKSSLDSTNRGPVGASRSSGKFIVIPLSSNRCLAMSDDRLYAKSRAACEEKEYDITEKTQ